MTGAGGGIGFEAARSLVWLGAKVIIAEIDKLKGSKAQKLLKNEFGSERAYFISTDVSREKSIRRLYQFAKKKFGIVDIIINNATVTAVGAVHEVGMDKWDKSYGVNLRGPVLMVKYFLPEMIKRNEGVIVFVPSSGAAPYLGAYEVFKTSQVELSNTLDAELENTGVITYSIGPGIVKTGTADSVIKKLAPLNGMTEEEIYDLNSGHLLSEEEAGAGFAASVALAEKYRGTEIGSVQALMDAGIDIMKEDNPIIPITGEQKEAFLTVLREIKDTFINQVEGWRQRNIFERQWIFRDFKKYTGSTPEFFIEILKDMESKADSNCLSRTLIEKLQPGKLSSYYNHTIELLKGHEKDPAKVKEHTAIIRGWIEKIDKLEQIYNKLI